MAMVTRLATRETCAWHDHLLVYYSAGASACSRCGQAERGLNRQDAKNAKRAREEFTLFLLRIFLAFLASWRFNPFSLASLTMSRYDSRVTRSAGRYDKGQ